MNPPILSDSGQFRVHSPVPEVVYQTIGPSPAKAPFLVKFTIANVPELKKPRNPRSDPLGNAQRSALKKCNLHFGRPLWVHSDGTIREKAPFWSRARWFGGVTVHLQIDFGSFTTEFSALKLPETLGPIEKIESGFSCDPWRLCIKRADIPDWNDRILFNEGSFILMSVYREYEQKKKTKHA